MSFLEQKTTYEFSQTGNHRSNIWRKVLTQNMKLHVFSDRRKLFFRQLTVLCLLIVLLTGTVQAAALSQDRAGSAGSSSSGSALVSGSAGAEQVLATAPDNADGTAAALDSTTMYVSSRLTKRHGLCVLLENVSATGEKHFGMIDTGNSDVWAMRAFLNSHGVNSLDFLVLTHMHADHTGNAVWLLKNYNINKLYIKQFDKKWSDGIQSTYEKILQAAVASPHVSQIIGVSYALSYQKSASPSASKGFVSFLKKNKAAKSRFKGLFTGANVGFSLGGASLRLYNWEIWSTKGTTKWVPGKNKRCKAGKYSSTNSDNNFSLGVLVKQGSQKMWIGGDINNLRLNKKRRASYKGDEERLAASIGKVDAAVLNHHGLGGSNCNAFLKALSPRYVIYTCAKSDITGHAIAAAAFRYIKKIIAVPTDHILWARDVWSVRTEDPSVTISSTQVVSAKKEGVDVEHNSIVSGGPLVVPLVPKITYTSYDVTGDGTADKVSILAPAAGSSHQYLQVYVNKVLAYQYNGPFAGDKPVFLVRLPGNRVFFCVSILSPTGGTGKVLSMFYCGASQGRPALIPAYDLFSVLPQSVFTYQGDPSITIAQNIIQVAVRGTDALSGSGTVVIPLAAQSAAEIQCANPEICYSAAGTFTLTAPMDLYPSINADTPSRALPTGTVVTVTHMKTNAAGINRYWVVTPDQQAGWINISR